MTSKIH